MKKIFSGIPVILLLAIALCFPALSETTNDWASIDIPYSQFVLENGLTVLVHEDHKAPIVAFNVWYHVGSKNEPSGRSGFAHLFEHLMFNGSENYDDDYFQPLERVGATGLNGTTSEDRTNYFENVPKNAFDLVLWMESDRMGHLLGAVTQAKLDEQRGVVQNEKRQGDNQPYSIASELITKATWPANHPYSHTVIGSMDDLNAAALDDVKDWFKTYYGPSNAVVVIAGDIEPQEALEKVKHYFGDIPAGPPVAHFDSWPAQLKDIQRETVQDRVPQARMIRVFNTPAFGTEDSLYLDMVTDVLGQGKTSRLYKRLVYDEQIATDVAVFIDQREIAGQLHIRVNARPGDDLKKVEAAVDDELRKFLEEGPTEEEISRVKTQYFARFTRGIERIGGFGGKSDILAKSMVYGGSADKFKQNLSIYANATNKELHQAAKKWLGAGYYNLNILPYPSFKASSDSADRSKLPEVGNPPSPSFPTMEKATLKNGLKIIVAQRKSVPVVNMSMIFDAGYAADKTGKPGTANLALGMLDEGTKTRSALEISEELANLGATFNANSNLDSSYVSMTMLKSQAEPSLDLYFDILLNPAFPEADFQRLKKQQLARIKREKVNPIQMALRVFPKLIYGQGHAYSIPFTGTGTEESVASITADDLKKFHSTWFKPNHATLVVVGDTNLAEIKGWFEKGLKSWKSGDVPTKKVDSVSLPKHPRVFLMDKPGAGQSIIFAGALAPPRNVNNNVAITMGNTILGGSFTSRINMNLREDKHWTYGARTLIPDARGQRPFLGFTSVQTDKTKESMVEMLKEMNDLVTTRPPTAEELAKVQSNEVLGLAGQWETNRAIIGSISDIVQYNLPENYYDTYPDQVKNLALKDVQKATKDLVHPDALTWIIVGDLNVIKQGIEELGWGSITLLDSDGNILK